MTEYICNGSMCIKIKDYGYEAVRKSNCKHIQKSVYKCSDDPSKESSSNNNDEFNMERKRYLDFVENNDIEKAKMHNGLCLHINSTLPSICDEMPYCTSVEGRCKDKIFSEYEKNQKKIKDDGIDKDVMFSIELNDLKKKWGNVSEEYKTMKRVDFCKNIPLTAEGNGFTLYTKGPCLVSACKDSLPKIKRLCDKKDATENEFVNAFDSYHKAANSSSNGSSIDDSSFDDSSFDDSSID